MRDIDVGLTIISKVLNITVGQKCRHFFFRCTCLNLTMTEAKTRDQLVYIMSVLD